MTGWRETVEGFTITKSEVRAELTSQLRILRDTHHNPDARPVGGPGSGCFTINLSRLILYWNLDGRSYDFRYQYEALIAVVEGFDPATALKALDEMVKTGRLPIGGELRGVEFHPLVIEKVRGLL